MAKMFAIPADGLGDAQEFNLLSGETFLRGALVYLDGTPECKECGANPTSILGVAAHNAGVSVIDFIDVMHVFKCTEGEKFWMAGSTNPLAAHVGLMYGVVKASGIWTVNIADTSATRVYVHQIDTTRNLFKVSVLVAFRQTV